MIPATVRELKVDAFTAWLVSHGCEVLTPTNEWEVVRFRARETVSIVYKNAKNYLKWTGHSASAYKAYAHGLSWENDAKTRRKSLGVKKRTLLERDGSDCFFCCQPMSEQDMTIEHLVPLAHGGPNHLSNLVLAHSSCNAKVGHMSAMEKVSIHTKAAIAKAAALDRGMQE